MGEVTYLDGDFARRDEILAGSKHGMHDDGEFAGNGHRRAFEPKTFPQLKAPCFEITNGVCSCPRKQRGRSLVEEPTQSLIPPSRDVAVKIHLSRLVSACGEAKPCADRSGLRKVPRVFDSGHIGNCCDRPDAWYYMPLIGGGILAVGWFVWLGLQSTPETGKTYQPAYEKDGRIGRITLNRPDVMNAIDDDLPRELAAAVGRADADPGVHVMVLAGAGKAFCSGYDLAHYAEGNGPNKVVQEMPWDPMQDFQFMWANTQNFMSLFRAMKPVVCKVHGFAVAGGSDIALCADLTIMGDTAQIGYMPTRVWGCPTTAMWVHRLGPEKAKRMMFTGDKISGVEAAEMGLILKSVPDGQLDDAVEALAGRMATVPINQLAMQKMVINSAVEEKINQTQRLATVFDGITRHSPEGMNFKARVEEVGWKQAVQERDEGTFDWTRNKPFD